jgi:hypothetical protein
MPALQREIICRLIFTSSNFKKALRADPENMSYVHASSHLKHLSEGWRPCNKYLLLTRLIPNDLLFVFGMCMRVKYFIDI